MGGWVGRRDGSGSWWPSRPDLTAESLPLVSAIGELGYLAVELLRRGAARRLRPVRRLPVRGGALPRHYGIRGAAGHAEGSGECSERARVGLCPQTALRSVL